MSRRRGKQSLGEMISSVTFFGFGLWLIFQALEPVSAPSTVRFLGLLLSGGLCIAAAFRFVIAEIFDSVRRRRK
ncbi:MAG: hypothetical protein ACKO56_04875 [Paracoccaceae bacterium]|jgi:NADH:ubiquinone oxidoreductase subunit 6 (subunit J)